MKERLDRKTAAPRHVFVFEKADDLFSILPAPKELNSALLAEFDIFICALGFENRCTAIPNVMSDKRNAELKIPIGLIGTYKTNVDDNRQNESILSSLIENFCEKRQVVDADSPEAVRNHLLREIRSLERITSRVKVCFDISACSGTFILTIVGALLEAKTPIDLSILYCQADQYFPTSKQVDMDREGMVKKGAMLGESDCYSEQGTQEPLVHPFYSGFQHEGRPDYVIAIPSFRMNRVVRCINSISEQAITSPESNVHWVFGSPNYEQDLWRRDFQQQIVVAALEQLGSSSLNGGVKFDCENSSNCCVFDYRNAIKLTLDLADKHLGKNITCIPMGTKMQSLGVALALGVRKEISVNYARPMTFTPLTYSEGIGSMWEVSLGSIPDLLASLSEVRCLEASTDFGKVGH